MGLQFKNKGKKAPSSYVVSEEIKAQVTEKIH